MQTFLPYPQFDRALACLDDRRLGKQRVEAFTILNTILERNDRLGWRNHPAVCMWRGHAEALMHYFNECLRQWIGRGFRNRMAFEEPPPGRPALPWWLGREELHASHRANLLRKDPDFYGRYGWEEDPTLPYWWPCSHPGADGDIN